MKQDGARAQARALSGAVGLGLRLRGMRLERGLTLAAAAGGAGVSLSYLSDIERGRRLPALDVLDRICRSYDALAADALAGVYPWGEKRAPRRRPEPPPDGRAARG